MVLIACKMVALMPEKIQCVSMSNCSTYKNNFVVMDRCATQYKGLKLRGER
jgi:hypothetical protein